VLAVLDNISPAILAGGLGTRLRSVIGAHQKAAAQVGGRPFLTRLFDQLILSSFRQVVLLTGYQAAEVHETLGESYGELELVYSAEQHRLGTGGAVRHALPMLMHQTVLLLNGDTFCDVDISAFCAFHRRMKAEVSVVVSKVKDTSMFGHVKFTTAGRIQRFQEKGPVGGPGYVNAGVYLIERRLFEELAFESFLSLERELFPGWVERGCVFGFRHDGAFFDIGTEQSYKAAAQFFTRR
jgi:D-glycero-alpha-D-manno-heptose 1-phosphate guanylyltransferase